MSSSSSSSSSPHRGAFILFEGLDRSGKSTQCALLAQRLGKPCAHLRFPDRGSATGQLIDGYLRNTTETSDQAIHLLFAANRWEKLAEMRSQLLAGHHLIVDRYSYSGVAYSAAKGLSLDWCWSPEVGLPRPDLIIFMHIDEAEAAKRGQYGQERYEKSDFQRQVNEKFAVLRERGQKVKENWVVVDGTGAVEDIHQKILALALKTIEEVKNTPLGSLE
jgi:dTMP kinase